MQISQIHDDLAKLSGPNPAGYIETQSFAYVTLDRLKSNAILLKNKVLVAGSGKLSAVLKDDHWSSKPEISLMNRRQMNSQGTIPRNPLFQDREVDVGITATLDLTVEIFIPPKPGEAETAGYKPAVISTVTISISNARSHLRAENNILIFEGADFDIQRKIQRLPGADDLLQAAGIDLLEAAYVEGHIGYGVVSQAVASALGQRSEISLATIFPSINFGKDINLHILVNGNALGIIPTEKVTLAAGAHCVCNEGPDFEIKQATIVQISSPPKTPEELVNSNIGNVSLGGPLPENKDPRRDFGSRYEGTGMAGLYIPQDFAQALTVDVMPSIKITASDNGTIGYRTEASVGFKNFRVSFDVSGGGILLDIDLDISVSAYCDMELFKGLRVPKGDTSRWCALCMQ